jgi:hypothetical protein|tara:strand:+ start:303 stop:668 length:366 start_codon:yes stop_codon:yes gene_type:complete
MGNFVSLIIDIVNTPVGTPTPTPGETPTPTQRVTSQIQEIVSGLMDEERDELLEEAKNFDPSVPLPTTSVTDALLDVYNDNIETFVGDYSYLKNTRTNKMSQGIFNRNTDSVVLGPNTFSK